VPRTLGDENLGLVAVPLDDADGKTRAGTDSASAAAAGYRVDDDRDGQSGPT
jgi:hypothetical protein